MDKKDFLFRFVPGVQRAKIQLDDEALYSTTDQLTADKISRNLCKLFSSIDNIIITDATACIGGSAYSLSKCFPRVNAIELDESRYRLLVHNIKLLGASNVICSQGDAVELCKTFQQDMIFIDPPWGGPEYKTRQRVTLELSNKNISQVCIELAPFTKYIALKVPTNFDEIRFHEETKEILVNVLRDIHLRKMNLLVFKVKENTKEEE